jgi:hypothetical protein
MSRFFLQLPVIKYIISVQVNNFLLYVFCPISKDKMKISQQKHFQIGVHFFTLAKSSDVPTVRPTLYSRRDFLW